MRCIKAVKQDETSPALSQREEAQRLSVGDRQSCAAAAVVQVRVW